MEERLEALSREIAQMQETVEMLIGYIEASGAKVAIDDETVRFDSSKTDVLADELAKSMERAARNCSGKGA